jgi:hypothetical protein
MVLKRAQLPMELDCENLTSSHCPQSVYRETANTYNIFLFLASKAQGSNTISFVSGTVHFHCGLGASYGQLMIFLSLQFIRLRFYLS